MRNWQCAEDYREKEQSTLAWETAPHLGRPPWGSDVPTVVGQMGQWLGTCVETGRWHWGMLKELKGACHSWDVGLKGVARLEGKGLQLRRLQRPCSEIGCHCLKALGVPRAGPLENPSGQDMEKGWKGTFTEYQQTESSSIARKLFITTKCDLS